MARFFSSVDNDKKNEENKADAYFDDIDDEVLSKTDKKTREIEKKAQSLLDEKNVKIFDKLFRKFIQDLKKYMVKENKTPNIVDDLFKKVTNKQNLKLIEEFKNEQKEEEKEEIVEVKQNRNTKVKKKTLDEILKLEDGDEKYNELIKYGKCIDTLLPLYFLSSKRGETDKMIELLEELNQYTCNKAMYLKKNISKYVEKIIENTTDPSDKLISLLEMYNLTREKLYMLMCRRNENIKTDDELFKPLYLLRSGDIDEGCSSINLLIFNKNDYISREVFELIAFKLLHIKKYEESYKVFNLFETGFVDEKYILCILTGDKTTGTFKEFLEEFKAFENNVFMLESEDKKTEIFRAFYYINKGCNKTGIEIINKFII